MVTETMLLLSIKQQNWTDVKEIAENLFYKRGLRIYKSISNVATHITDESKREIILLTIWANVKWQKIS